MLIGKLVRFVQHKSDVRERLRFLFTDHSVHHRFSSRKFNSSRRLEDLKLLPARKMVRLGSEDPSSFAQSDRITTTHSVLHWVIDFVNTKLKGNVVHHFNIIDTALSCIYLDIRDITIFKVELLLDETRIPLQYCVSDAIKDIGEKLTLELPKAAIKHDTKIAVSIDYETSSNASALQWLTPEQTLGKEYPYMFSHCQAIHARSILPCQDTPSVKFTYAANVEHPSDLTVLMSALLEKKENNVFGVTSFRQNVPIPAYLLAIAVGRLVSRPLGANCNVWAEEGIIDECAEEFSQTPEMLKTASRICGNYVWQQYDLLVMPPSFPYGGMENPCLTFVTPTLLAGDKSLASVVAHEIAHSWTGNLVTNKNFEHFWLNEGFTVFVEAKIVGHMKGSQYRDFHMLCNLTTLQECIRSQLKNQPELTKLVVDLSNCGPDDAFSSVPYIKGSTFLRYLEDLLGGPNSFEPFFQFYLKKFAFKSVETNDFKRELITYFTNTEYKNKLNEIDWDLWLNGEGMPPIIPKFDESIASVTKQLTELWQSKTTQELRSTPKIKQELSSEQIIDFLHKLFEYEIINDFTAEKIDLIEDTYNLKNTKNAEIRFILMRLYIRAQLLNRLETIIDFVNSNFRMKFCRPIYRDLGNWPEARSRAIDNFQQVKNQMMEVCVYTIKKDLNLK